MRIRSLYILIAIFILISCQNEPYSELEIEATVQARVQETLESEKSQLEKLKDDLEETVEIEINEIVPTPTPIPEALPNLDTPLSLFENFSDTVVRIETDQGGVGTGFFISSDGLVITNAHVVGQSSLLHVTLSNGDERIAEVLGFTSC